MPFKSLKQKKYLYGKKPEVAKKFAEHEKDMPDKKMKKKMKSRMTDGGKMKY